MFCPLHRAPVLHGNGGTCATCDRLGLVVVECEIDKINRCIDTANAQDTMTYDPRQSHAVLVFTKNQPAVAEPSTELTCPEDCDKCSGEYCETHNVRPCDCDVVDRHRIEEAP